MPSSDPAPFSPADAPQGRADWYPDYDESE
jgi:hypothetical protein